MKDLPQNDALLGDLSDYIYGHKPDLDSGGLLGHQFAKKVIHDVPTTPKAANVFWRSRAKIVFHHYCEVVHSLNHKDILAVVAKYEQGDLTEALVGVLQQWLRDDIPVPDVNHEPVDREVLAALMVRQSLLFDKLAESQMRMRNLAKAILRDH